jgi:hypothetical protein
MKSFKKLIPLALWLGALLVGAFALLYFEADLLWKVQQHNVFLNTALFFKQQMVVPGGMLSYLGAFLTQHFYYPWVGVVVLCALWLLMMWLTKRAFNIPEQWMVLTLIPVAILLVANMDLGYWVYVIKLHGYFFVPTLGVIAATALFWTYRQLPEKQWVRAAFVALVAIVGYPLMGIYALAAVVLMAVLELRIGKGGSKFFILHSSLFIIVVALLSVIMVPLMYYRFVYYETNLVDIYRTALPVFTISESYPEYYYPYYALALCFLLLTFICHREWKASKHPVMDWMKQGVVLAAVVGCVYHFWYKDANFHHELRMQRCVESADWEGVITEGAKQEGEPTRAIVMMHNLALSRLGRQCDEMYSFPKGSHKPNTPLPIYMYHVAGRMMLYQYGMMNECHRICMEDGVEYGWNVELLRYMARCAIFSNEKQAARKFLDILRETTYYGSWADHMEALMNDPKQLAADAETGLVMRMQHYTDKLDAVEGKVEKCIMTMLANHDADDLYFQEQAVLGAMWTRNPDLFWSRFDHYVQLNGEDKMPPRIFQEAAWLFANMQGMDGLDEWSLLPGVKERFASFMRQLEQYSKTRDANIRTFLYQNYANTYYFEYFFLKDITYY